MGIFKTIAEGGQIWTHRVRMVRQVIRIALFISLGSGALFFGVHMLRIPKTHYQAGFYYLKARFFHTEQDLIEVSGSFWQHIEHYSFSGKPFYIRAGKLIKKCDPLAKVLMTSTLKNLNNASIVSIKIFIASLLFFFFKGWRSRKKKHLEGQKMSSPWKISLSLRLTKKASPITINTVPLVKGTETRHILITGSTGSGKTNCFHHLLPQIRKLGQRAIIVDTTGEFIAKYFQEGKDILLNPFDQRSVSWHPWSECFNSYDYKTISESFIPSSHREEENFWRKAAQEVFCAVLHLKAQERLTSGAIKLLLYDPLSYLYKALQHSKAAAFLDPSSEKTAGSIRAVAASFLECLELLDDTTNSFSIKSWVTQEKDNKWLFLSSSIDQRAALLPLISAWFSIAMRSLLSMAPNLNRRLWFITDELPSLNRLKDLETCLKEGRKFGGCALLALQSLAELEIIYGRELSKVIIGNCCTRIAFCEQDPQSAASISKIFGEKELQEFHESLSYGSHEMRDGVNLSLHNKKAPVVTPTALMSLKTNEAFIKLPDNIPITKIKLKYLTSPAIATPFQKK